MNPYDLVDVIPSIIHCNCNGEGYGCGYIRIRGTDFVSADGKIWEEIGKGRVWKNIEEFIEVLPDYIASEFLFNLDLFING